MSNELYIVKSRDEALEIDAAQFALSKFPSNPNIGVKELEALIQGSALVDLSDGEYIHWLQLTPQALEYLKTLIS